MPSLAIYLLGPPRVELDGEELHIPRRKALALLAYLAVERLAHRRDSLAALLWPEYDQRSARADLRRTLSTLNRTLGEGWLVADRESVRLHPDIALSECPHDELDGPPGHLLWLDIEVFRQRLAACQAHAHPPNEPCAACVPLLEEAVELYRGDFMSGFALRDSLAFDEWQFFQTERLKDQLASALERLVRWYTECEEYDRAIAHARRRLEHDTLNETAHYQLMELLALAGQQTAALRQYELCRQTLAEELGVPPSPETVALHERIQTLRVSETLRVSGTSPPRHNLPPQSTPFIGRETELAELSELVVNPETRLVTILGPGGIGKSRLALALAERLVCSASEGGAAPVVTDGVFFASLARLSDANQIVPSIAEALNFRLGGGEQDTHTPRQQVLDYLREKRLLLILDNFEHLLEGVDLVTDILRTAPAVQLLVTSRERLQLREEHTYTIEGLDYPDDAQATDWRQYAATQLFMDTARRVQTSFELSADDAVPLVRICRMLDGMPLGIELAAGWVDVLSLSDIAAEIDRGLDLLETEWHDVPTRHRSMDAVFDTSWRYLTERDRDVLEQLCVFRGGFTREAAREVAGADLRPLARLVDKSLLQFNRAQERYEIHELLRQYGSDKLAMDPEREAAVHERHSTFYCTALGHWSDHYDRGDDLDADIDLEGDWANVRTAWEVAAREGDATVLDRAIDGLGSVAWTTRRFQEVAALLRFAINRLRARPEPLSADETRVLVRALLRCSELEAKCWNWDLVKPMIGESKKLLEGLDAKGCDTRYERGWLHAMVAWSLLPDFRQAVQHYEQALALHRETGYLGQAAIRLLNVGQMYQGLGEHSKAKLHFEESLALSRALTHHSSELTSLLCLGQSARNEREYGEAKGIYEEAVFLARTWNDRRGMADSLERLGYLALFLGDFSEGVARLRECTAHLRAVGSREPLAFTLIQLGAAHWFCGEFDKASGMLYEAQTLADELDSPYISHFYFAYRAWLDAITGRYDAAQTHACRALEVATISQIEYYSPGAHGMLGWIAVAKGAYVEAESPLNEIIVKCQAIHVSDSQEYGALATAALGRAEYGLGKRARAKQHLLEALRICAELRAFIPLLHLMPIIPVVLADEDDPRLKERAVELYAMSTSHPFVAKAQLFEDIAGRYVRASTADLPRDVVAAAQERGRALDWWETAEALLDELKRHGWSH